MNILNKKAIKIIILGGYAGSGKDYFADQIKEHLKNPQSIAFADKFKSIISKNLPINLTDGYENSLDALDSLKNTKTDTIVFENKELKLNMRDFLKYLLGGTIRGIHKDIHCAYTMKTIYEKMQDKKNIFICTDNRYLNEQSYLLSLNILKNQKEQDNFIRQSIHEIINNINIRDIEKKFEEDFSISTMDNNQHLDFILRIKNDFIDSVKELKRIKEPKFYCSIKNKVDCFNFDNINNEKMADLYAFHIFREAVPKDYIFQDDNTDIKTIAEYSGITKEHATQLIKLYQDWGLKREDIKKYGICRVNPTSSSESEIINAGRHGCIIVNKNNNDITKDNISFIIKSINNNHNEQKKITNHNKIIYP